LTMELNLLRGLVDLVLVGTKQDAHRALQDELGARHLTHPAFIEALASALEQTPSPLKLSDAQLVELLNRIKAPTLRSAQILKKVPDSKKSELHAALDRYPLLAQVLAQNKSMPLKDLVQEHEKLVKDLKPVVDEYEQQTQELKEYREELKRAEEKEK